MTTGTVADAGPVRSWWRRWRWPVLLGTAMVAVVTVGAIGLPRGNGDFDPDSAQPEGTLALVRILTAQGIDVHVVRSIVEVDPSPDATLLVSRPAVVPFDELRRLRQAGDLVLIAPDAVVLDELAVPVTPAGSEPARTASPGCDLDDAAAAGAALAGGRTYRLTGTPPADGQVHVCYPAEDSAGAARGALVVLAEDSRRIAVVGQPDLMRNAELDRAGNAALAVRLLGQRPRLQWYVPDPAELPVQESVSPLELLPDWVRWVPWQLALTAGVVMIWRGRRLGPLVSEPLPVVVRSAETHEGRARLYRRAGARDRAGAALRTASARRLAARLQAGSGTPTALADRVAHTLGRDPATVRSTLIGPAPDSDDALVALANELAGIEEDMAAMTNRAWGEDEDGR